MLPCDGVYGLWSPLPDACLEIIDTDRPHQTDTPHVVAAGHAQIESGLAEVQIGGTIDGTDKRTHLVLLDDTYAFGVVSHVGLQLLFKHVDWVFEGSRFVSPGPLEVRVKLNFIEGRGATPAATLVPTIFVPFSGLQPLRAGALVFLGWDLPLGFELEANLGVLAQPSARPSVVAVFASALTHRIVGPLSGFVDVYATGLDVQLGTGFLTPIGRDLQIDFGTYIGLNGFEYAVTPFIGFSIRR